MWYFFYISLSASPPYAILFFPFSQPDPANITQTVSFHYCTSVAHKEAPQNICFLLLHAQNPTNFILCISLIFIFIFIFILIKFLGIFISNCFINFILLFELFKLTQLLSKLTLKILWVIWIVNSSKNISSYLGNFTILNRITSAFYTCIKLSKGPGFELNLSKNKDKYYGTKSWVCWQEK